MTELLGHLSEAGLVFQEGELRGRFYVMGGARSSDAGGIRVFERPFSISAEEGGGYTVAVAGERAHPEDVEEKVTTLAAAVCLVLQVYRERMTVEGAIRELEEGVLCAGARGQRIFFLEEEQILDPELRRRAIVVLGPTTWEGLDGMALWAAVRRYASMIEEEDTSTLLPLLRAPEVTTRQVGLQALAAILGVSGRATQEVRDAVVAMDMADNHVLLLNAYVVLALAGDERTGDFGSRLEPRFLARAERMMSQYRPASSD